MDDKQKSQSGTLVEPVNTGKMWRSKVFSLFPKGAPKGASRFIVSDEKCAGQYVAMPSFNDRTVITHGPDRAVVLETAEKMGYSKPVIYYLEKED